MKNKKPNAELVWKQLEDQLAPRLALSAIDRTVYSHLLRHSRLEGKLCLRFSIRWLARHIRLSAGPVRGAVRRLVAQGALRLVQRSKTGHVVGVRPPEEIRPEKLNGVEHRPADSYRNLISSCKRTREKLRPKAFFGIKARLPAHASRGSRW